MKGTKCFLASILSWILINAAKKPESAGSSQEVYQGLIDTMGQVGLHCQHFLLLN